MTLFSAPTPTQIGAQIEGVAHALRFTAPTQDRSFIIARLHELAHLARRMERTLDEIVAESQEEARLATTPYSHCGTGKIIHLSNQKST